LITTFVPRLDDDGILGVSGAIACKNEIDDDGLE
jgi:hypothetical protein